MHRAITSAAIGAGAFVLLAGVAVAGYAVHHPSAVTRTVTVTRTTQPRPAPTVTRTVTRTVTHTRTVTEPAGYTLPCYVNASVQSPLLQPAGAGTSPWQKLTCSASVQDIPPQAMAEETLTITASGYGSRTYLVTVPGG